MSSTQPEQQALAAAQDTIKDLQAGNLPSNQEITKGISEVQQIASENKDQLSQQGQKVVKDTNQLLETIKKLVDDKNSDEYLQKAFTEAYAATDKQDIEARRRKIKQLVLNSVNSQKSKDEAAKGVDNLMTVARLLVSSAEFRSLINDLETLFEQAFVVDESSSSTSTSTSTSVSLASPTAPLATGTPAFVTSVTPVVAPTIDNMVVTPANGSAFGTTYRFGQPPTVLTNPATHDPFHLEPRTAATASSTTTATFNSSNVSAKIDSDGAKINVGGVTAGDATQSISTDQAKQEAEDTLIDHYAKIAHTLNEHPEYRNAINYLMDSASKLSDYVERKTDSLEQVHDKESSQPQNKEADAHAREAWANAKHFLENWVGPEYSLDEFLDSVSDLANKAKNDDELAAYFKEVREFFEKSAADKAYVQDEERVKADARQRIRKGRQLAQGKYKNEFEKLKQEFEHLNDGIQSDEGVKQLESDFQTLVGDLFLDENGNATLHTDLLRDLQVMIPALIKKFRRLPLPEMDISNEDMVFKMKNAVLDCADIAPSHFEFTLRADTEESRVRNVVQVVISKIRARILGADIYVNKKTFPKVEQYAKADMAIYGKHGMTVAFELCPWDVENKSADSPAIKMRRCMCSISKLDVRLSKTHHDVLFAILSPIINAVVKGKIEEIMKENLRQLVEEGSRRAQQGAASGLASAKQAAQSAAQDVNTKPLEKKVENALN